MRRSLLLPASFLLTALASVLLYWLAFTQPYNLFTFYPVPLFDLYKRARVDPLAPHKLLMAFMALAALYWLGWRAARKMSGRAAWLIVILGAAASGAVLLFVYPFDAADIFDNIMHGRILGVYGANPFAQAARQFKTDPFYLYTGWKDYPSAYGPIWETLAGVTARLAGDGVTANVLAFKLLNGLFFFTSLGLVVVILRQIAPERMLAGAVLFAWNPIILYETFASGHNDIALAAWILAAAWAMTRRRYTLAALCLVVGALIKFMPVLLLPAASLITIYQLPNPRARLRFLITTSLAAAVLIVVAYAPFWMGRDPLGFARRNALLTTSLPAVLYVSLMPWLGEKTMTVVNATAGVVTIVFAVWQGWRATSPPAPLLNAPLPRRSGARRRLPRSGEGSSDDAPAGWGGEAFIRASFNILMFYLLVTCPWFQSWYALWPLALAALLPPGHLARLGALFGFAVLSKPLVFAPMFLWIRPLPPKFWRELRLGPTVMAIPWLYALYIVRETLRQKRLSTHLVNRDVQEINHRQTVL
jgi:hypothetical protein